MVIFKFHNYSSVIPVYLARLTPRSTGNWSPSLTTLISDMATDDLSSSGGEDGIHQNTIWANADMQEKQMAMDTDDAVLMKMGKKPKMKRRYNFWTRE